MPSGKRTLAVSLTALAALVSSGCRTRPATPAKPSRPPEPVKAPKPGGAKPAEVAEAAKPTRPAKTAAAVKAAEAPDRRRPARELGPDEVMLAYSLEPGVDLRYKIGGSAATTMPMDEMTQQIKITGTERLIVGEVDRASGQMLVGRMATVGTSVRAKSAQGDQTMSREQKIAAAFRVDRTGKVVARAKDEDKKDTRGRFARQMLSQLMEDSIDGLALTGRAAKVGEAWTYRKDSLPLAFFPMAVTVKAKLTEIKTVEGRKCARVVGTLESAGADQPGMELTALSGSMEIVFDTERGIVLERTTKLKMKADLGGRELGMDVELSGKLESMGKLAGNELARHAKVIRALDGAMAKLLANEADAAVEALEELAASELPDEWKPGINMVTTTANQLRQFGGSVVMDDRSKPGTPEGMLAEAHESAASGRAAEAVEKYAKLAEKHPKHAAAAQALSTAARIAERDLGQAERAAELRGKLLAIRRVKVEGVGKPDPLDLYRLASASAEAGRKFDAIEQYTRFVASKGAPARYRVLAQYRAASMLEALGRRKEARQAYRALEGIETSDGYSRKIKDKAKRAAAGLAR